MSSIHNKLERVRKPRVHIKYDVETEGGAVQKELPFVVGVMGDFSGDSKKEAKPVKDRKFVQIDRDNFNDVMGNISPGAQFRVENVLEDDGSEISVQLEFNRMEDFEPENIVQQVEPLRKLQETRDQLRDLITRADRSDELENILEKVLQDSELMQQLSDDLQSTSQDKE